MIDVRGFAKRNATIIALYRWLQFRRSAQLPWEGVPPGIQSLPIGRLEMPSSLTDWEAQRQKVRAIVIRCLGHLPARPSPLNVRTLSTDQKDGYKIEKFIFHNGVDSEVLGYIAIPIHKWKAARRFWRCMATAAVPRT